MGGMAPPVDRRAFLRSATAVAATGVLAACTDDSRSSGAQHTRERARTVVTGSAATSLLDPISADAEKAAGAVIAFWGEGATWRAGGRAHVAAFTDRAGFVAAGGDPNEAGVTATTTEAGTVLLSPALVQAAAPARIFVLTHELTHVRLGVRSAAPRWVAEGAGELTALLPSGLTLAQYAPSLAARVAAGDVPGGPPTDPALAASATDLRVAYQQACAYSLFLFTRTGAGYRRYVPRALAGEGSFRDAFAASQAQLEPAFRQWLIKQFGARG